MGLRIAIAGSGGLIGRELIRRFREKGHTVSRLVREAPGSWEPLIIPWIVEKREIGAEALNGQHVVINLAGANIAEEPWSEDRKKKIVESRTRGTEFLCQTLARLPDPPKLYLQASAIGYYGIRKPDETMNESAPSGKGFLAEVAREWERSASWTVKAGIRTIFMRFGLVLSPDGGALARMLPIFRKGFGGRLGNGRQMMSWIALEEIPLILDHLFRMPRFQGPINFVSPNPVSNREFTKTLGRVLKRPTLFPAPAFALRRKFGEMADEALLGGQAVTPQKILESGYRFQYPDLEEALRMMLGRME